CLRGRAPALLNGSSSALPCLPTKHHHAFDADARGSKHRQSRREKEKRARTIRSCSLHRRRRGGRESPPRSARRDGRGCGGSAGAWPRAWSRDPYCSLAAGRWRRSASEARAQRVTDRERIVHPWEDPGAARISWTRASSAGSRSPATATSSCTAVSHDAWGRTGATRRSAATSAGARRWRRTRRRRRRPRPRPRPGRCHVGPC
ncbi:hypothetical protein ZEAMMB73_Zm00001d051496, partial [Zea mays]